jgi:hypothetical protein
LDFPGDAKLGILKDANFGFLERFLEGDVTNWGPVSRYNLFGLGMRGERRGEDCGLSSVGSPAVLAPSRVRTIDVKLRMSKLVGENWVRTVEGETKCVGC